MIRIGIWLFICSLTFMLFPGTALAVDYSITEVNIDAYLQPDGRVEVQETHTYEFDGKFNGITRELVPKKGSKIIHLTASESGRNLEVEQKRSLYKIHRQGRDEQITVVLTYMIENGVEVYTDVAQFYWPFFDRRNESDYEQMTITVHPPANTSDVIAFGYDEAFQTEEIIAGGAVRFHLGKVPSERNGDIRVAYDAALFPAAELTAERNMMDEILKAEQKLYDKAAARVQMRENLAKTAAVIVPIFTFILLFVFARIIIKGRMRRLDVERQAQRTFFTPKEALSIPATIYFTKGILPTEAMAAALLDLMRKGLISKVDEDRYVRTDPKLDLHQHEHTFLNFLFNEVGSGTEFRFKDLEAYTKNKKNHEKFQTHVAEWRQKVIEEVKQKPLYEKISNLRGLLILASVILLPFVILFPVYELYGWFVAALLLFSGFVTIAAVYRPKTAEGLTILHEWRLLKERLPKITAKQWEALTSDDQMRTYIYGLGSNDQTLLQMNKKLIRTFQPPHSAKDSSLADRSAANQTGLETGAQSPDYVANVNMLYMIGALAAANFRTADQTTAATTTSTTGLGGGGVGGGGGGSGAF